MRISRWILVENIILTSRKIWFQVINTSKLLFYNISSFFNSSVRSGFRVCRNSSLAVRNLMTNTFTSVILCQVNPGSNIPSSQTSLNLRFITRTSPQSIMAGYGTVLFSVSVSKIVSKSAQSSIVHSTWPINWRRRALFRSKSISNSSACFTFSLKTVGVQDNFVIMEFRIGHRWLRKTTLVDCKARCQQSISRHTSLNAVSGHPFKTKGSRRQQNLRQHAGTFAPCRTLKIVLNSAQHSWPGN